MIEISLVDNKLTPNPIDCRAVVQNRKKKKLEDLVQQITIPGSILKETECVAVADALFKAIAENIKEGYGLQTDYISYLYQNTPKMLQVELPDTLESGTYELEVHTHVHKAKELRTGFTPFQLQVV